MEKTKVEQVPTKHIALFSAEIFFPCRGETAQVVFNQILLMCDEKHGSISFRKLHVTNKT